MSESESLESGELAMKKLEFARRSRGGVGGNVTVDSKRPRGKKSRPLGYQRYFGFGSMPRSKLTSKFSKVA